MCKTKLDSSMNQAVQGQAAVRELDIWDEEKEHGNLFQFKDSIACQFHFRIFSLSVLFWATVYLLKMGKEGR